MPLSVHPVPTTRNPTPVIRRSHFSIMEMRPKSEPTFRNPAAINSENITTGRADAAPNTDESNSGELLSIASGKSEPK